MLEYFIDFLVGGIVGGLGSYIGYRTAKKYFQLELIELIKRLPEDVQNEVLAAMNKDIEESKNN